jgi:hypothetical protein
VRDMNVEQLWYALWVIKGIVSLCVLWVAALICKWLLRRIPCNRANRRSVKHKMVHLVGAMPPPRNCGASEFKAVHHTPNERSALDELREGSDVRSSPRSGEHVCRINLYPDDARTF